jgi:hypothetical protein
VLYVVLVSVVVFVALTVGRSSPRRLMTIGFGAVVLGIFCVALAEISGNVLLFYGGGEAAYFGLFVFLGGLVADVVRKHGSNQRR